MKTVKCSLLYYRYRSAIKLNSRFPSAVVSSAILWTSFRHWKHHSFCICDHDEWNGGAITRRKKKFHSISYQRNPLSILFFLILFLLFCFCFSSTTSWIFIISYAKHLEGNIEANSRTIWMNAFTFGLIFIDLFSNRISFSFFRYRLAVVPLW